MKKSTTFIASIEISSISIDNNLIKITTISSSIAPDKYVYCSSIVAVPHGFNVVINCIVNKK